MNKQAVQKLAVRTGLVALVVNAVSANALVYLQNKEIKVHKMNQAKHKALHKGFEHLIHILERENVELTEFDTLALQAFMPNPQN